MDSNIDELAEYLVHKLDQYASRGTLDYSKNVQTIT